VRQDRPRHARDERADHGANRAEPAARAPRRPDSTARAPHELRIIGGQWRRHRLPVLDAPGLRPTPDRVRETLFNWLGQELTGWSVLDAFAGTGALGFEAASRGAATVQMLERDGRLVRGLDASRSKLGADAVSVIQADAIAWMRRVPRQFDLVLLDPPFDAGLFESALDAALPCVLPRAGFISRRPASTTGLAGRARPRAIPPRARRFGARALAAPHVK
jgi:16S rRNA (guanine(966)-N(2))-methyltransferase RsmD